METMRAFIAVDIGDEIRSKLDDLQRKLKKVHADVRWVKPRNIHLTLAFLGDIPVEKTNPLTAALDATFTDMHSFELHATGTGSFGNPRHPRVIWAGLADCPELMDLHRRTIEALKAAEIEFDNKPFSPHLTLGRVKAPDHTESLLGKLEKHKDTELGEAVIDRVELIQSTLAPRGAEYTTLHRIELV